MRALLRRTTYLLGSIARSVHTEPKPLTNKTLSKSYFENLPYINSEKAQCIVKYIWIDSTGVNIRGKSQVLPKAPADATECPWWSFDGSSTGQALGKNTDLYLKPSRLYKDPFRLGNSKLLLCEVLDHDRKPVTTNNRHKCEEIVKKTGETEPWFGFEQEYVLLGPDSRPFGWPVDGFPEPQGPYYCGTGTNVVFGRDVYEASFRAMIYAGVPVQGVNVEVMPAQLEFQVGAGAPLVMADGLWAGRYILNRVAEDFGVSVTYDPKPMGGDWNGSGTHASMSTKAMREDGGLDLIKSVMPNLAKTHLIHMARYDPNGGADNRRRMTGKHETSAYEDFSWGISSRNTSIRIAAMTALKGKGWFEDRRPASNMDPYSVVERLLRTVVLHDLAE